jgi:hypothetical protein
MDEPRIDLAALELDSAERELLVAAIMTRADAELTRRSVLDISPLLVLSTWARPALAAAAAVALVCAPVLFGAMRANVRDAGPGLADALSVPAPVNAWLVGERAPTVGDLLVAMESEGR